MSQQKSSGTYQVSLDERDRIIAVFRGPQTAATVQHGREQILRLAQSLRSQGKRVNLLIDAQTISPTDTTSGARQQALIMIKETPFDRFAVCGQRSLITLAAYIIRLSGKSNRVQFFGNRQKAESWLVKQESQEARQSSLSRVSGIAILLIGLLALIGWHIDNPYLMSWLPELRPMNPIAALALMLLGIGFFIYSGKMLQKLRWASVVGILIGFASLLPTGLDTLLYGDRVAALGPPGQIATSAALCFIAIGIIGLVAHRPELPWRRTLENSLAGLVALLSLVNIYGQLYARDWLAGIGPHFAMSINLAMAFLIAAASITVLTLYSRTHTAQLARISRTSLLIVAALILVQAATYGAWSQAVARNHEESKAIFQNNLQDIKDALEDRFAAHINLLHGFQGLFRSSSAVPEASFQAYYDATQVSQKYPGLETLTFSTKLTTKDIPAFLQKIRTDVSLHPQGHPDFTITQLSQQNQHYILTYVADDRAAGGIDFSSNTARREAFERAEASGRPIASGTVTYAPTKTTSSQNGFFITVPVSFRDKPQEVAGFVNAVFSYKKFFADTFNSELLPSGLSLTILDTKDGRTVFDSNKTSGETIAFHEELSVAVADRTWLLNVSGTDIIARTSNLPTAILLSGQVFSLLIIIIFWLQARARKEALDLADSVTKDLQQERNLAVASDQRNQTIFASIGDGIFVVDKHRIVTLFNPAMQQISGFSESQAIGQPCPAILRFQLERTGKVTDAFIKKALAGDIVPNANHTILIHRSGKYIPVSTSAAPIRDAKGNVTGAIVVVRDVSKEYALEKAKSEFVSLTSHQLRTPLSAINWYAEMLLNGDAGKVTDMQRVYLQEIFTGSNRMVDLVGALLDASRIDVGKLTTKPEPTDMNAIIASLSKELQIFIDTKQQDLRTHMTHVPIVDADPRHLRMIAQNLISNAVKYTPEHGTIDVTLRTATKEDLERAGIKHATEPYWYFCVQDTGYGIPKDDQLKIFDKLYRADNARSLNVEGTGLGLYIAKEVVSKMGGKIWFDSLESVGTTFTVVAPIKPKYKK